MTETKQTTSTDIVLGKPHNVVLFNDDHHDMGEVALQIIKAIRCDKGKALSLMMEAHLKGRAIVYTGGLEKCEQVETVLNEIRLGTKIEQA